MKMIGKNFLLRRDASFNVSKSGFLDLYDCNVIGWALNSDMRAASTTIAAWRMAVQNRPISAALVFHSDRGIQYTWKEFTDLIESYKSVERSMSRKGNYWDLKAS
jgi:transposase InsO family protein